MLRLLTAVIDLLAIIFKRILRVPSPQEKLEKKIKDLEAYHKRLENELAVAIIKRDSQKLSGLRAELRSVVDRLLILRQKAGFGDRAGQPAGNISGEGSGV